MDYDEIKPNMVTKELKRKYGSSIINSVFLDLSIQVNFNDMDTARKLFDDLYDKGGSDIQLNYYNQSPNVYVKKDFMIKYLFKPIKAK
jgi:gamma-glutamyl-gamma-aminobutyrate hydrolase PuuD